MDERRRGLGARIRDVTVEKQHESANGFAHAYTNGNGATADICTSPDNTSSMACWSSATCMRALMSRETVTSTVES